jgi:hypothetical protein
MFRKVRLTEEDIAKLREEQQRLREQQELPPMIFVQVTEPTDETPTDTPFYSSASSRAANPETGNEQQVRIDGTQTRLIRTEDVPRTQPGSPATPAESAPLARAETAPAPPPPQLESVAALEMPVLEETVPDPVRQPGIGELAMVTPAPRPVPPPEKTPPPVETARSEPVPRQPQPVPEVEPARTRPRTVAEAKLRQELLTGEKTQQEGGVQRKGAPQLEVKGRAFGAYDEALVLAVQQRWYDLLDKRRFAGGVRGRVVINFKLYSNGTVSIVEPAESDVDALHEALCIRAVRDPAPYETWPAAMLREVGRPYREMRFTFFYN